MADKNLNTTNPTRVPTQEEVDAHRAKLDTGRSQQDAAEIVHLEQILRGEVEE